MSQVNVVPREMIVKALEYTKGTGKKIILGFCTQNRRRMIVAARLARVTCINLSAYLLTYLLTYLLRFGTLL